MPITPPVRDFGRQALAFGLPGPGRGPSLQVAPKRCPITRRAA